MNTSRDPIEILLWRNAEPTRAAHTAVEVMLADDEHLEVWHDWIQWAFPLPEASKAVFNSPVADIPMLKQIGADQCMREVSTQLAARYYEFLENTKSKWATHPDHNWLRISRAIRSLTLQGIEDWADRIYHLAVESTANLSAAQVNAWPHWCAARSGYAI